MSRGTFYSSMIVLIWTWSLNTTRNLNIGVMCTLNYRFLSLKFYDRGVQ